MKIGYTTGVFDLFHIGHLNLIRNAKKECDYLIVGVTTDKEAFKLKKKLPIIPFDERLEIVKSIKYVDEVYVENDSDKVKAWEKLKFHIIFKGTDWKGSHKWNEYEKKFSDRNVNVHYFPYTTSTSSTKLRVLIEDSLNHLTAD